MVAFTRDRDAVRRGLDTITPFGSTALHDALDKAAHDLATWGEGRRAVVVLTDGIDTSSQKTADEVIARSRALDVPIYAISVVSPLDDPSSRAFLGKKESGEQAAAAETLSRYATLSGGASYRVSTPLRGRAGRRSRSQPSSSISTASGGTRLREPPATATSWCGRPARESSCARAAATCRRHEP